MNITARAQGFDLSQAIDTFVREELQLALRRFSEDVLTIDVFMKDTNGPKGGVDKQVLVRLRLRNGQLIAMATTHEDLYAAIKVSVKRSKRAVRRNLRKSRRVEKQRLRDLHQRLALTAVPKT